ncbi:MAG: threonylcarbamoyl-AMP synthase [Candidatus Obscuribacter sp.]|nr:threonylcarbamoyl-AMP synthase [Candidatus Obscuribacter sp.]
MLAPDVLKEAVDALKRGELVAFPTETVYGLGADGSSDAALSRLYSVKGRPTNHPVIVHIADVANLSDWAVDIPEQAYKLAAAFWPGPMTLILKRQPHVSDAVTGGQDSVGIRIPAHPVALELLAAFGGGVAAPSANRFGKLSPTTASSVVEGLGRDVSVVLDGGPCQVGIESTIISLVDGARILRPGMLSQSQIEAVLGQSVITGTSAEPVRAPGTLDSHYAPETGVAIVPTAELAPVLKNLLRLGKDYCLLAFADTVATMPAALLPEGKRLLSVSRDSESYARLLYQALKDLDSQKAAYIVVQALPTEPDWHGIVDRLTRSSHGTVLPDLED